ncbi:hypothetical protein K493DRAFT_319369 [Basidiobolus meristosporus CBS 931.73]|uniref:Uncharacterized protein n=1 Tax=Basidiobolus meristosporus CBS 931.73 TaxID=1314790 RepID=A0A1Y1XTB8_9FUNG|nr:hypothetical protein K493DRAFT_319369 [Basidiobolus meristosporus CBS 931.73]|eukprot:ORX88544.1 hypothetical protein K493DRAFT_319369 [Basidiobolus meristosporus CBS 931.73]
MLTIIQRGVTQRLSGGALRRLYSTPSSESLQNEALRPKPLTFWQIFGGPLTNLFLWGSVTTVGLHFAWSKLYHLEYVEEMEAKVQLLENKIVALTQQQTIPPS